jgi:RNA-directed DNA polymerase
MTYPRGKGGTRRIAQPSRELKAVQRFVVQRKLTAFPVHGAATAYVKGRNIFENAVVHRDSRAILKLDFSEFFPSIVVRDWERFATANPVEGIKQRDMALYSKILFWGVHKKSKVPRCLSVGAPSSPTLSNILLFELDTALAAKAVEFDVAYTRYADDITASADSVEKLRDFEAATRRTIKSLGRPKLTLNEGKCGLYLKGQRRMVTGLIITPTHTVSIGRERKRLISAMLHRASLARLGRKEMGHLKGLLGFCLATEPTFVERMRAKYADDVIDLVLRFRVPKREELADQNE